MAVTTSWIGNAAAVAQTRTYAVTGASGAAGQTVTATLNGKSITYTTAVSDTNDSVATAFQLLLSSSSAPPEFQEITFTSAGGVITAVAVSAGVPFAGVTGPGLSVSGAGGLSVATAEAVPNSSPSDVNDARNWLRLGAAQLPQNGDDVAVANSSVPLLYNLDKLASVAFKSYTRWQSFTGTIGLPEVNPNGYYEWRATYFRFAGSVVTLPVVLGQGVVGSGPGRERYDLGSQQYKASVLAAGPAQDAYAVRLLGNAAGNTVSVVGTSVGVAMLPGESATLASVYVGAGGSVSLGQGVVFAGGSSGAVSSAAPGAGSLTVVSGSAALYCAPGTVSVQQGGQLVGQGTGLQYGSVSLSGGSSASWLSDSGITTLTLTTSAVFDKSQDVRPVTVTNCTQDADTTQVNDPYNAITFTNPVTLTNAVSSGPFVFGAGRQVTVR